MPVTPYREHAPPPELASYVDCFWTVMSDADDSPPVVSRVIPDGCVDFIFDFTETPVRALRSFVVGAMTTSFVVAHPGGADMLAVRFKPGGVAPFLRIPVAEVTDQSVELDAFGAAWREAASRIHSADHSSEKLELLVESLSDIGVQAHDRLVAGAWSRICATSGGLRVDDLADQLGVGKRKLERLFYDKVGLTPKEAGRVARFRAAIERLRKQPHRSLGQIGLEAGYYDQPHFIREFSRLAGITPDAWRSEITSF